MAHLSHKTLVYLPEMRPEHEAEEGQPRKSLGSFSSWPHRLENVFPVYAMGTSNPAVLDSSLHTSDCLDPIWDAVREEAKLEVPIKVFLSFFLFFMLNFFMNFIIQIFYFCVFYYCADNKKM